MTVNRAFFIAAAIVFLLVVFGVALGSVPLVALGLAFVAFGLAA